MHASTSLTSLVGSSEDGSRVGVGRLGSGIDGSSVGTGSVGSAGSAVGEVDVELDRQVGVVAHVQVAGDLRVAADDLVDERVGQEHVEGVGEVVAGVGELGQHRVELRNASMVAALDAWITRTPTPPSSVERLQHPAPGRRAAGPASRARSGSSSSAASMVVGVLG